jgi:hypothetical protein
MTAARRPQTDVHELIRDRDDDEDRTVRRTIRKPVELAVLKLLGVFVDTLRECGRDATAAAATRPN